VENVETRRSSRESVHYRVALSHISEDGTVETYVTSVKGINQSIFIMERQNIFCEMGTELSELTKTNVMSQNVHVNIICGQSVQICAVLFRIVMGI
jgi:hypothetical protein